MWVGIFLVVLFFFFLFSETCLKLVFSVTVTRVSELSLFFFYMVLNPHCCLVILYNRQLINAKLWKCLCNFPEENEEIKTL